VGADGRTNLGALDVITRSWFDEYRIIQMVPMTHDQFLDADPVWVRWMLNIDAIMAEKANEQQEKASRRQPGGRTLG